MSMQPDKIIMCPICLETMRRPILQCQRGHSMCGDCIQANKITICPQCRGPMSTIRSLQLEQLIESMEKCLKLPCYYVDKGCSYSLPHADKEAHELECKYRTFACEGKKFAKWKCDWRGEYKDIETHFQASHKHSISMQFKTEAMMKMSLNSDFCDVQIISFGNGAQYFYYKHKLDVAKQKAYWVFQLIGTKSSAEHYYYEFEIYNGNIRKFKVTEICVSDTADVNKIFEKEKCVCISFATLKNFLNEDGELPFKFRLMTVKHPFGVPVKNPPAVPAKSTARPRR